MLEKISRRDILKSGLAAIVACSSPIELDASPQIGLTFNEATKNNPLPGSNILKKQV